MKKFLQLDSKSCNPSLTQEDNISYLSVGWSLNFTYLIQNISLCLNPSYLTILNLNRFRIYIARHNFQLDNIIVLDRIIQNESESKPKFFQKLKLQKPAYLFNTIVIQIQLLDNQLSKSIFQEDVQKQIRTQDIKKLGFQGIQIQGFNTDIYQSIQQRSRLYQLYSKLSISDQILESNTCYFHIGLVGKNCARFTQAQQIFKKLLRNEISKSQIGEVALILNIIDCSSKQSTKLEYLAKLSNLILKNNEYQETNLFKYSDLFVMRLLHFNDNQNYIMSTTVLNILNYFLNKVGCSIAPLYENIILQMISIIANKAFIKNLRRQSHPNYQVLISSIEQFLEVLRQCVAFLSSFYIQKLTKLILSKIYKPQIQCIQPIMIKLLYTLIKECQGSVEVSYDDWIRLLYLVQGEQMIHGIDINHDMFYNRNLEGMVSLYEQYKKNILKNISQKNRISFLDSLNKHFTQIICNQGINVILISHFIDIITLFCMCVAQHQIFDHTQILLPFLQPFKSLIPKLLDTCIMNEVQFNRIWESFVHLFSLIRTHLDYNINNVIITLLNKMIKDTINPKHITYISIIIESYINDNKYLEVWERFVHHLSITIPNSIYSQKIYCILKNIIEIYPNILLTTSLNIIIQNLINPYSEYNQQWIRLIQYMKASQSFTQQVIMSILKLTINPYKSIKKSKVAQTVNYKKQQVQIQTKKIYILNKLLTNLRISQNVIQQIYRVCTQISNKILQFPQQMKSIMFYKYFYLMKILSANNKPISQSDFNIVQIKYPPIIYSFLICVANSRHFIKYQNYNQIFHQLIPLINQPWKNIQQLSLKLLIYFSKHCLKQSIRLVNQLLEYSQIYKITVAITILYQISSKNLQDNVLNNFIILLQPTIEKLKSMNSIKQIQLLIRYTLNILNKKLNLFLGFQDVDIGQQEQNMILITLDYEKRIDHCVKKQIDKPIQSVLKLDQVFFGIPKRFQDKQQIQIDEIQIVQKIQEAEDRIKKKQEQLQNESNNHREQNIKNQNQEQKQKQREIHSNQNGQQPKQINKQIQIQKQQIIQQNDDNNQYMEIRQTIKVNNDKRKVQITQNLQIFDKFKRQLRQSNQYNSQYEQIQQQTLHKQNKMHKSTKKIEQKSPSKNNIRKTPKSSTKHLTPKSNEEDIGLRSSAKSKAVKQIKKNKQMDSPVIEIQSKNSKFKINLAQLHKTWRQSLNMISKKHK